MRVLLFETTAYSPASPLFLEAAQELAAAHPGRFEYRLFDEAPFERSSQSRFIRLGRRLFRRASVDRAALNRSFLKEATAFQPDLVLICKGAFIAPDTLARIRRATGAVLVNYATDDPFNPQVNTRDLVDAIPLYDLYACTKRAIMDDVAKSGCANVIYLPFAYKPSVHFPEPPDAAEAHRRFDCDAVFIGGCDRDRIPYFQRLVKALPHLTLALYGAFWNRSRTLRSYWRGFALGRDFRMALGGARIAINLVRNANRDGHVMRSFEIPACGAFMLAERTSEHLDLFAENREAAYFRTVDEMVDRVKYFLDHEDRRITIADAGRNAVVIGNHTYRHRLLVITNSVNELRLRMRRPASLTDATVSTTVHFS